MRTTGIVFLVIGIVGTLFFGMQAIQDTETFNILGLDVGVSGANWTPAVISALIFVIGIVLIGLSRRVHV